jgi:hypothetical protein
MSRRLQTRERVQVSAAAAIAADHWITARRRQQALHALLPEPAVRPLLAELATNPRIVRRLPNAISGLLETFTDHPQLAPWLKSEHDFFSFCRMTGAALYGTELAKFVDGDDVAALVDDLGAEAWRFGVENAAEEPNASPTGSALNRNELTDDLLASGLRAVHAHLQDTLPDHLSDIGSALDIDWNEIDRSGDPERDREAVRRVLAR